MPVAALPISMIKAFALSVWRSLQCSRWLYLMSWLMSVILSPCYLNRKLMNVYRCILQRSSWFLFGVSRGRNFDEFSELTNATTELYSYQHNINTTLRTVALRTFVGSCATLISSVVNLTVLMVLKGEQGWICLMCCNADSKFLVLKFRQLSKHWHLVSPIQRTCSPLGHSNR